MSVKVSLASEPGPNCSSNGALEHSEVKQSIWLTVKALILQDVLFQWSFKPTANLLITANQSLLGPCWPKHLRRQKTPCSSWHLQVITHGDSSAWKNNLRTNAKRRGAFLFYRWNYFLISKCLRVLETKGKLGRVKKIRCQVFIWELLDLQWFSPVLEANSLSKMTLYFMIRLFNQQNGRGQVLHGEQNLEVHSPRVFFLPTNRFFSLSPMSLDIRTYRRKDRHAFLGEGKIWWLILS